MDVTETLQKGIRAARRGKKEAARQLLAQVVEADPNHEEAWMWLARVVDDPQQKAACLQRVVDINPDNQWAAEQLAAVQAPSPEPTPEPTPDFAQPSEIKLEVLKCPNCNGSIDLKGGEGVRTVVCKYCGSVLDLTEEEAAIVGQAVQGIKPAVPIELGMEGAFEGETYQVIGWLRYEGWDDEESWTWDEWLLVSGNGQYRWLAYDEESGFKLYKKIEPTKPFNPRTADRIPVPGGVARIVERAPAKIVALAGELTWRGEVGEQFHYIDAKRGRAAYSVEYTDEEIELLQGESLSFAEVQQAFGIEVELTESDFDLEAMSLTGGGDTVWYKRPLVIFALIILVIFLCVCLMGSCTSGGTSVSSPVIRSGSIGGPSPGGGGISVGK